MKYAINYYYDSKQKELADELHCDFNQIGGMYDFIKKHPDKRYVINLKNIVPENLDLEFLNKQLSFIKAIVQENYSIKCEDIKTLQLLLKNNINAYLSFTINDWETFSDLAAIGVSDIIVDGAIGFQCNALKRAKEKFPNLVIRAFPHCSIATLSLEKNLSKENGNTFFIRPEDTKFYEESIDVFDFTTLTASKEKMDTLFNIYKRKRYDYNLSLLINQLNIGVLNAFIKSDFAEHRLNCAQKCKIPGGRCNYCNIMLHLTNNFVKFLKKEDN